MFDARKRRRGELFNVSITEVILLILFLLLLLFAVFYKDLEKKYNELKNTKEDVAELLVEIQEYRDTTGYTGPAQIKDELAELGPSYKDLKEVLYLQKEKISELEEKIKKLEAELEVLESVKDLSKIEDLQQKIDDIAQFKEILKNAEPEQVEELVAAIEELLDKYGEDFDKLIEEIENLAGNALPRCWPKSYPDLSGNDGERLFTIRLQSNGIWVEPDFDERFNKEYSYLNLNEKYFRTPLPESLFLEIFSPLFELSEMENSNAISITEQRRCRHEVRIFDELSNDKEKYKRLTKAIEGYFYRFEFRDDTYCDYRRKTKNDSICLNK
jgi:polyhydroxyalkanoate synthesis regulator phasin